MKVLCFVVLCFNFALGANILGIWFHGGKSHHILGEVLLKELARRGHNVTMASAFPLKESFPNYTDVYLSGILEDQKSREDIFLKMNEGGIVATYQASRDLTRAQTEITLVHPEMKKLLESGTKFDVIIMDWFANHAILYFGKLFDAPVILSASSGTTVLTTSISGNPAPPSYVPVGDFPEKMTFMQRLINGISFLIWKIMVPIGYQFHYDLVKKHFNDTFTYEDMQDVVALMLSNAHYVHEPLRPYVPNVIPVGGYHITPPQKLPKRFQEFMDNSENGVIFFSLGSNMKSSLLPEETKRSILKVFSKLPYRIIWKWENEDLEGKPDNLLISEWCSQNEILAHPKVKLFITHGGLLSTTEAIHYGIPIIGIPIFGDQRLNVPTAVRNGYAIKLELHDLNEETFSKAIHEILNNPSYRQEAKKRSKLLRDRPLSALDTAVFWVEHIIRHKGGDHLKTFGTKQPMYQYLMLDVILFVAVVMISISIISYLVIRRILAALMQLFKSNTHQSNDIIKSKKLR